MIKYFFNREGRVKMRSLKFEGEMKRFEISDTQKLWQEHYALLEKMGYKLITPRDIKEPIKNKNINIIHFDEMAIYKKTPRSDETGGE